jgi:RNA 2',3'-cyclic 3'-phosphodiesterase
VTRAFVAIRPPDDVLDAIAARTAGLDFGDARRTAREQWHLTLQFLGDSADPDAVATALSGLSTVRSAIRLSTIGPLGNPKRSMICACHVSEGGEWVRSLAAEVNARLAPLGHEPEHRPFLPHLTIARFRRATNMKALVAAAGPEPIGGAWPVAEVVVYESRLGRGPAEHLERSRIRLLNA